MNQEQLLWKEVYIAAIKANHTSSEANAKANSAITDFKIAFGLNIFNSLVNKDK